MWDYNHASQLVHGSKWGESLAVYRFSSNSGSSPGAKGYRDLEDNLTALGLLTGITNAHHAVQHKTIEHMYAASLQHSKIGVPFGKLAILDCIEAIWSLICSSVILPVSARHLPSRMQCSAFKSCSTSINSTGNELETL